MPGSAGSAIGANRFLSFGKMVLLIHSLKTSCRYDCPMLTNMDRALKEKGRWRTLMHGWNCPMAAEEKPVPCPAMPAAAGTFYVTWTRTTIKAFATERCLITGDRLIYISAEPSMPSAIYYTAGFGPRYFLTLVISAMKSLSASWLTRE